MDDPLDAAWKALREQLEARYRELYEAVRAYPTPIARCDDQLPKAIADRDAARDLCVRAEKLERELKDFAARVSALGR
jgi:hypothetical protein